MFFITCDVIIYILDNNCKFNLQKREVHIMAKNDRFEKTYSQGTLNVTEIWVDRETGVNYVFHASGYAGGMTPLLDRDGKPVITTIFDE